MINLFGLSHRRARTVLDSGAPVFLLVNPVEYHGPHLSLHNDRLVSEGLARAIHARLAAEQDWPLLVTPDLEMGVEPVPGPGARAVPYAEVRRAVRRAAAALHGLGARRVVLMSFHGNPLHAHALHAGVDLLGARGVPAASLMSWLMHHMAAMNGEDFPALFATIADPAERRLAAEGMAEDFHAGFIETSFSLALAPDSVDPGYRDLPPCPPVRRPAALVALAGVARRLGRAALARELEMAAFGLGWFALRPFPGYTGRPHLASEEAGRLLVDEVAGRFAEALRGVLLEGKPAQRPPFGWAPWLSLGGRIGGLAG